MNVDYFGQEGLFNMKKEEQQHVSVQQQDERNGVHESCSRNKNVSFKGKSRASSRDEELEGDRKLTFGRTFSV